MSTRETALAAVATTLSSLASGRVYRSRQAQLPAVPAIVIEPLDESVTETVLGRSDHVLRVAVRVFSRGDVPDTAADTLLAAAWAALYAAPDLGLGTDVQLMPGYTVAWDFGDDDLVRATLGIELAYRTAVGAM